jgi:hypothetical protein
VPDSFSALQNPFQNCEIAWIPGPGDHVILLVDLAKHSIVNVHDVGRAEFLLRQDRGDHQIVFQNVDRRPLRLVGIVQRSRRRVFPQIVRVTREGIIRHFESGQVLAIRAEPVDFPFARSAMSSRFIFSGTVIP